MRRLIKTHFDPLNVETVRRQIKADQAAINKHIEILQTNDIRTKILYYETLFDDAASECDHLLSLNAVFSFCGYSEITLSTFIEKCSVYFDFRLNRWASSDVYRRIPGICEIEKHVGSDETGWLFR